jgi:hypothetical protein
MRSRCVVVAARPGSHTATIPLHILAPTCFNSFINVIFRSFLQGYIESGKVEDLLDEGSSKGKRRELRAELTKVQGQLEERQAEIERLKQA